MANLSKKEIRRRKRKAIEDLGRNPDNILTGKHSIQGGTGKSSKRSKHTGSIVNQRGAFGKPSWKRELMAGVYETFSMTNYYRHQKAMEDSKKKLERERIKIAPLAREL